MSTPERRAEEAARRRRAVAAGGALAVGAAAQGEEDEPSAATRAAVAGTILAALVTFLAAQRQRTAEWLRGELGKRAGVSAAAGRSNAGGAGAPPASLVGVTAPEAAGAGLPADIEQVVQNELEREQAFAQKSSERVARDITTALMLPTKQQREDAVRRVMAKEQVYARQRTEATAARAFAAVDRVVLRGDSPQGAFWKLDPDVAEHTAGCLLMGGRFWPWAVLDRVHPPRHPGCPCRLISYGQAVAEGLLRPEDVLDVRKAISAAAHVVMEGAWATWDDFESVRDLLFEGHLIAVEDAGVAAGMLSEGLLEQARDGLVIGMRKPEELREALDGVGLGRDRLGFFVYSHEARSKSFRGPEDVPAAVVAELAA